MVRSDSITKISVALLDAQKNMGNATKDSKNTYFKSSFADLNSVREAATPALNAAGITVLQPTVIASDGSSYIETTLLHSSGEYLSSQFPIIAAKANDPQAFGSAVSYARRYALQSFLSIGAVDDDSESAMGRSKSSAVTVTTSAKEPVSAAPSAVAAKPKSTFAKRTLTPNATASTGDDI